MQRLLWHHLNSEATTVSPPVARSQISYCTPAGLLIQTGSDIQATLLDRLQVQAQMGVWYSHTG